MFSLQDNQCYICKEKFKRYKYLKDHIRNIHYKVRRHGCEKCGSQFFSKSELHLHILRHYKHSLYLCSRCGKGFSTKSVMTRHERESHDTGTKYVCTHCDKVFATLRYTLAHQKRCKSVTSSGKRSSSNAQQKDTKQCNAKGKRPVTNKVPIPTQSNANKSLHKRSSSGGRSSSNAQERDGKQYNAKGKMSRLAKRSSSDAQEVPKPMQSNTTRSKRSQQGKSLNTPGKTDAKQCTTKDKRYMSAKKSSSNAQEVPKPMQSDATSSGPSSGKRKMVKAKRSQQDKTLNTPGKTDAKQCTTNGKRYMSAKKSSSNAQQEMPKPKGSKAKSSGPSSGKRTMVNAKRSVPGKTEAKSSNNADQPIVKMALRSKSSTLE